MLLLKKGNSVEKVVGKKHEPWGDRETGQMWQVRIGKGKKGGQAKELWAKGNYGGRGHFEKEEGESKMW